MKLQKAVYKNGEFVNQFSCEGESANIELINLLLDANKKRYGYKVNIKTDHLTNEIKATLKFEHKLYDGSFDRLMYTYNFTDVDRLVDLH